jgi:cell division protein FtsI/penicillin-binding protein 2
MFHRRLLLLMALMTGSVGVLTTRVYRLALVNGDELRKEAEARLVKRQWMPCVRGSILDRKGRILAQDRPSYDVAVDYRVITGEWAKSAARDAARHEAGHGWLNLSPAERESRVARWVPAFQQHLQTAWGILAERVGTSRARIDVERDRIVTEVEAKYDFIVNFRRVKERAAFEDRGQEITTEMAAAIEKQIARPIGEQASPHVLVPKVTDEIAFDCRVLATDEVDLRPSEPLARGEGVDGDRPEHVVHVDRVPGLQILDTGDRLYPFETVAVQVDQSTMPGPLRRDGLTTINVEGLAAHILGTVRDKVWGSEVDKRTNEMVLGDADRRKAYLKSNPDVEKRAVIQQGDGIGTDRGEYRDGDRVGDSGVERSMEHVLRGLRGVQVRQLDTDEKMVVPAEAGRDVHLTIDAVLQARVQAVMSPDIGLAKVQPWHGIHSVTQQDGTPLYGAAVVLDIDTGDVVAMVSTPSFTRDQLREHPETLFDTTKYPELLVTTPTLNRAMNKAYQPGSIVKALLLTGAVTRGTFSVDQHIACTGHLLPNQPNMYRCWIYKQHATTHNALYGHDLSGSEAIMASCNIFFFTLGKRLGVDGIRDAYRAFGVGESFDLGAGPSFSGLLGKDRAGTGLSLGDAIQMGIGQGPVAWTPLHAANAFATVARGGVMLPPRMINAEGTDRREPRDLVLNAAGLAMAKEGLRLSVGDARGTGHHILFDGIQEEIFNAPGVMVWGKTGTAASSPVVTKDPDGEGPMKGEVLESGDHSWFVVMVGRNRPQYVISVVMDFAGSGGKVSGPIANQIIHALVAEGYL